MQRSKQESENRQGALIRVGVFIRVNTENTLFIWK